MARDKLDSLWEHIILGYQGIRENGHMDENILHDFKIKRTTQFDFEILDSIPDNLNHDPPMLFQTMLLEELTELPS